MSVLQLQLSVFTPPLSKEVQILTLSYIYFIKLLLVVKVKSEFNII